MKIAFLSDTHFGEGRGTEREEDPWEAAGEALERIEEMDCDLVVHGGDVFDSKNPRPDDWSRALEMFADLDVPMAAIHGNHERRGTGLTNPVEGLARSGLFTYLNAETEVYELDEGKVAVHGMGWVPEKYAKDALTEWAPEPVEDAYNVLVLHQSIDPFIYNPLDPPSLSLEDMPPGFQLYVTGHIHERQVTEVKGSPFLVVGSTVTTQVNKAASEHPPGFVVADTEDGVEEMKLDSARQVFYREIEVGEKTPGEVEDIAEEWLDGLETASEKKPLVRFRVTGDLPEGVSKRDIDLSYLREVYSDDFLLSIGTDLREEELERKEETLQKLRDNRLSVQEIGFQLLRDFMEEQGSDLHFEDVFDHLVEGDDEAALATLLAEAEEPGSEGSVERADETEGKTQGLMEYAGDDG